MALSSPDFRSRTPLGRNRRKSELAPIFIPRLSEWRDVEEQQAQLSERLLRARRVVWVGCYVIGFGSGLLTANLLRSAAVPAAPPARVKKAAPVKKAAKAKKVVPAAASAVEAPVVTIREVKR